MNQFVEIAYTLCLLFIFIVSLGQLQLVLIYLVKKRPSVPPALSPMPADDWPSLTIQLPVYNEVYVVDRLIDTIVNLHYPPDKVSIQVLDDSTDETTARIARKVATYQQMGVDIVHIRRPERTGFKAGALRHGLACATGEYIAIFDADFLPDPDFLLRALPSFQEPNIAVVQTRWKHINESYSLLTTIQAMGLNAHFFVEQNARFWGNLFLNFNGTAGIWRKEAIIDAGNWHSDTLTEDLDLSYRAQLKGWKIVYRDDMGVPGELPVTMNAIRSQQYRWMKGPAECARKHLSNIITAPNVAISKKIQACLHLTNSSLFIVIFVMALLSVPVLYNRNIHADESLSHWLTDSFFLASLISLFFWGIPFYKNEALRHRSQPNEPFRDRFVSTIRFLWLYPIFLAVMLGLTLQNGLAVLEGYMGVKTPFVRTPKFNLSQKTGDWETNVYNGQSFSRLVYFEVGLALYFGSGVVLGVYWHDYTMLSFHLLLTVGYCLIVYFSLAHARAIRSIVYEPTTAAIT